MTMPSIRVLAPEEHDRIVGLGPFEHADVGPDAEHSTVVVVEDADGEILGYWCAFDAVHVELLWVSPEARENGVAHDLWDKLREVLIERSVLSAFAIISDEDLPTHMPMAHGIGFRRIPGSIFFVDTPAILGEED